MSFYITIKQAILCKEHFNQNQKVSVVVTSQNNRLFGSLVLPTLNPVWKDAFVAGSNERQLQFMLIRQKVSGKSAKRLSSNCINLSKYLFLTKTQTNDIPLFSQQNKQSDTLTIQIIYQQKKNYIGPIQFYKKGHSNIQYEEQQQQPLELQIQGDSNTFPSWRGSFVKGNQTFTKDHSAHTFDASNDQVKFYKGPPKIRNMFSLCEKVCDDQKFTVVENCYNNE